MMDMSHCGMFVIGEEREVCRCWMERKKETKGRARREEREGPGSGGKRCFLPYELDKRFKASSFSTRVDDVLPLRVDAVSSIIQYPRS